MQYVSQNYLKYIKQDHTVITKAVAIQGRQETVLDVLGGSVVYNLTSATHSSLDLSVIDYQNRAFDAMATLMDPFISVFQLWRGIRYPSGAEEFILLGHYYADHVGVSGQESGYPVWSVSSFDASGRCQDDLKLPLAVPPLPVFEAVQLLVKQKFPQAQFRLPRVAWSIGPLIIKQDQDPWAEARRMALAAGYDLVWHRDNVLGARIPILDITNFNSVWEFTEGVNAEFWDPERDTISNAFPNVVIVQGTNPGAAGVTGIAKDNDPLSATYVGKYERVLTVTSEYPLTSEQANAMARAILAHELGAQDEVTLTCIPNPALDDGDIVTATSAKIGLDKTKLIIRDIKLPLSAEESMTVTLGRSISADTTIGTPVRR